MDRRLALSPLRMMWFVSVIRRAFDVAPSTPVSGASFSEKAQVDLPLPDDIIALRDLDLFPRYSLFVPVRSKNPDEVWDASRTSWIAVFGNPRSIQMDEAGEWKHELWVELRTDRFIELQFQCVGAHPWTSERRNGLARGIYPPKFSSA